MSNNRKRFACKVLGRDNVLKQLLSETPDAKVSFENISGSAWQSALMDKLMEEVREVVSATSVEHKTEELADVLDVMEGIKIAYNISDEAVLEKKQIKINKRGEMKQGVYVIWLKTPAAGPNYHYLKNSGKYKLMPELSNSSLVCFEFEKLVRDHHVNSVEPGTELLVKVLSEEELRYHLNLKLLEEGQEIVDAKNNLEELTDELGDVSAVIDGIMSSHNISNDDLEEARRKKSNKFGKFKEGLWVNWIEVPKGARMYEYALNNAEKYQEIPIE